MILGALSDAGGREYLARQAELNPAAFMTLVGKIIPTVINATVKRDVRDLDESELLRIATIADYASNGGHGAVIEAEGVEVDPGVH